MSGRFSHNKTFGSSLESPATLGRIIQYIKDQGVSNYCTAFARASAASYFFGHEMSAEFQTAKEGQELGYPIYNGADTNSADIAAEEFGFLLDASSPLKFEKDGWTKPADWTQYPPELDAQAFPNSAVPFNAYPDYQSIKAALISGNPENAVVIASGYWYQEWNDSAAILPVPTTNPITRHVYLFVDFKMIGGKEYLVAQLSQGTDEWDGGVCYMSEEVVNTAFKNPSFNGLGCEIYRKGAFNVVQTKVKLLHQLLDVLGRLRDLLLGRP